MDNGFRERQDQSGLSANGVAADGNLDRLLEAITNGVHDAESAPGIHCSTSGSSWDVVAQHRSQKRKRTESDIGDSLPKLRRIIQEQVLRRDVAARNMTTIIGYHAAAAQKSYGLEKRFLCPPPLVRVNGPLVQRMKNQEVKMTVVSEQGATLQDQVSQFDPDHNIVFFKSLHINSQGKDKSFQLLLNITDQTPPSTDEASNGRHNELQEPWAVIQSSPVHIISKPAKKTTRGSTPGIMNRGSISLFNRINSQTVRTKYLSHNAEGFTTGSTHWSPFTIMEIVSGQPSSASGSIVYGSRIILKAPGFQSHEYIIRKVEKHRSLATEYGRQVSQMQKIALLRADLAPVDGQVCYLSALVERPGNDPINVVPGSTHATSWRLCEVKQETLEDGSTLEYHEVNDYATWMIASISQFQCAFFDASGTNNWPPQMPITPAPAVASYCRWIPPAQRGGEHSLEMSVSGFYGINPTTGAKEPLQVWVGDIGPLRVASYEGLATQTGPLGSPITDGLLPTFHVNTPSGGGSSPGRSAPVNAFVAVTLPPVRDLIRALMDSVRVSRPNGGSSRGQSSQTNGSGLEGDLDSEEELWARDPILPVLFLRKWDDIGFHSGYVVRCVPATGSNPDIMDGWTVRVEKADLGQEAV